MSIQILGGVARGKLLKVPSGDTTRPTSVMLRRKLFDAYQNLEGYSFFDLCAGTGAMGFEAWSRGAAQVVLNEKNRKVQMVLEQNLHSFQGQFAEELKDRPITLKAKDCLQFLQNFKEYYLSLDSVQKKETILFFDPPYEDHDLYLNVLGQFHFQTEQSWFAGELWLESDEQKGLKLTQIVEMKLPIKKNYVQGTSFIVIIK